MLPGHLASVAWKPSNRVTIGIAPLHHNGVKLSVSEKSKPTYDLDAFKSAFVSADQLQLTGTALRNAASLGFGRAEIVTTIQTMQRSHFYKSMTAHADHRIWQDVYHVPSSVGELYVKFTADTVTEFLLLSFKEKNQ